MHTRDTQYFGYDPRELDDDDDTRAAPKNLSDTERWISLFAGGALAILGLSRKSLSGTALAALGGAFVYRGATARCPVYRKLGISTATEGGTELALERSITVHRPRLEVYQFFHNFENLPRFMKHLKFVTVLGGGKSQWAIKLPGGRMLEWKAQTIEDREGELIRWRSLDGSDIEHHGEVRFLDAGSRGTEVHVCWKYLPPGKVLGAIFAKLAESISEETLHEELRRFKQIVETGEVATTEGQPSGRKRMRKGDARLHVPLLPAVEELEEMEDMEPLELIDVYEEEIFTGDLDRPETTETLRADEDDRFPGRPGREGASR